MIGNVPAQILARCPDGEEAYITADVDLARVRQAREFSRNFQQRRPRLYGVITRTDLFSDQPSPAKNENVNSHKK